MSRERLCEKSWTYHQFDLENLALERVQDREGVEGHCWAVCVHDDGATLVVWIWGHRRETGARWPQDGAEEVRVAL